MLAIYDKLQELEKEDCWQSREYGDTSFQTITHKWKKKLKIQPEINPWLFSCQPVTYMKQLLKQRQIQQLLLLKVLMLELLPKPLFPLLQDCADAFHPLTPPISGSSQGLCPCHSLVQVSVCILYPFSGTPATLSPVLCVLSAKNM